MKIGEVILEYRRKHKLSQRQFAKKCGDISNGYISMLENDMNPATNKGIKPTVEKLKLIANGMEMSLDELFRLVDDMPVVISSDSQETGKASESSPSDRAMNDMGTFGTCLRAARKEMQMTQRTLAELIGAKHNSVSDWENDKNMPDPDAIVKICEALNVRPDYLLVSNANKPEKSHHSLWEQISSTDLGDALTPAFDRPQNLSSEAIEFAYAFDRISEYGKAIIRCVMEQENLS